MERHGLGGEYNGNIGGKIAIATFIGVALYNSIELGILVFASFARYQGLYFWSLLIAGAAGVVPYSLGYMIKFFHLMNSVWLAVTLISIGWWCMITGQSFVLFSRLHLVQRDRRILRPVLTIIIANIFLLHVPTTVLTFGSNSNARAKFMAGYEAMEKIQMTGFFVQELLLSTLYIIEAVKILRLNPENGNRGTTYQLLGINFSFILMDLVLVGTAFANFYAIEVTLKAAVYSLKLKLEFAVLGKLVGLVNSSSWNPEFTNGPNGLPDFVDASRLTGDVTRVPISRTNPPKPPWVIVEDGEGADIVQNTLRIGSVDSSLWNNNLSRCPTAPVNTTGGVLPSPTNSGSDGQARWSGAKDPYAIP